MIPRRSIAMCCYGAEINERGNDESKNSTGEYLLSAIYWRGASADAGLLAHELRQRGHEVNVATVWSGGLPEVEDDAGVRVFRLKKQWRTWLPGMVMIASSDISRPFLIRSRSSDSVDPHVQARCRSRLRLVQLFQCAGVVGHAHSAVDLGARLWLQLRHAHAGLLR